MSDLPATPRPSRGVRRRFTRILFGTLALTALVLSFALILPDHARAAIHPGGDIQNPVIRNVDIARPAVVRILLGYRNPGVNVRACPAENSTFTITTHIIGGVGSGAFISSHGDILTANHVANPIPGEFEIAVLQDPDVGPQILADIKAKCHVSLTSDQLVNLYIQNQSLFSFDFSNPVSRVWLDTSNVGSYSGTSVLAVPSYTFHVLGSVDTYNVKGWDGDVAIIHIDGLQDTPSIPIGDSDTVSPTDELTLIGYPGNGDANHIDTTTGNYKIVPTDFLTESINDLTVSAIKTNDNGGKVIQIGGNLEHGDSGGPALNAAGQIVGLASFGVTLQTPDNFPDGTSFLTAVNNAQGIISQANIDTTPGTFENKWRQALTDFGSTAPGHWHKAASELQDIQTKYPNFKGADDYLTYAQQQAQNESTSVLSNSSALAGIGLAALAGIALLAVIIAVVVSRRRKPQAAVAVASPVSATYTPQAGYPPSAPQGYPATGYPPSAPQGYPPPPPASPYGGQQVSAPAADVAPSAPSQTVCVNGHPMQPNEIYCPTCGAARKQ